MSRDMSKRGIDTHGRRFWPRFTWLVIAVAGVITIVSGDTAWAYPPAGPDDFPSSAKVVIDLTMSSGPVLTVTVAGPVRIMRGDPIDRGDGRIEIDTEIVEMHLEGPTNFGKVTVERIPFKPSLGKIKQQVAGVDFPADSFFDVFFNIIGTPMGTLHNNSPMRLQSMGIIKLPPLGAIYTPPAVVGVALFDAMNVQVGVITHATHDVGQRPSFTLAPGGTPGGPAVIFDVPTAPRIQPANLGLGSGDVVDGLSYGVDYIPTGDAELCFSVDPASKGKPGTPVNTEATKSPPEAQGDEFCEFKRNVWQELDETGDTARAFPLALVTDDVATLEELPASAVDTDGNGVPDLPVYFSLRAGSPALGPAGATPADILKSIGGAAPTVFIPQAFLGLGLFGPGDDLEDFCLDEGSMAVVFSLRPGSPTLAATGECPSTLFFLFGADHPLTAPPPPGTNRVPPTEFGLLPTDNLDALKCIRPRASLSVSAPTLSPAGLTALLVALMAAGGFFIARRRQAVGRPRRMAGG